MINAGFRGIWGERMQVSYKKLWKLLIDRDMKKKDLLDFADISWATVTKMSKNEKVSMDMLMKVCSAFNCNVGDILEFLPDDPADESEVK